MQPEYHEYQVQDLRHLAVHMERAMLEIRRHWFGAKEADLGPAISALEPGGELLMCVDATGDEANALISEAAARGAYVVATSFSRPTDLTKRLRRNGYRPIQRHWAYVFDATGSRPEPTLTRRSLLSLLRLREPEAVQVQLVEEAGMEVWNEVCWRAFGPRGTREEALRDKLRAFRNMGSNGSWYLASLRGRPAGTACVYQGTSAAQVLAVGTLPGLRGRGIASAVMQRLLTDWQASGHGTLFLDTNAGSTAERLYLRLGFRPAYLRELYAPVPGPALTGG